MGKNGIGWKELELYLSAVVVSLVAYGLTFIEFFSPHNALLISVAGGIWGGIIVVIISQKYKSDV